MILWLGGLFYCVTGGRQRSCPLLLRIILRGCTGKSGSPQGEKAPTRTAKGSCKNRRSTRSLRTVVIIMRRPDAARPEVRCDQAAISAPDRITLFAAKSDSIVELLWKSTAMLKIQAVSVNLFVNRILVKTSTFSRNGKNLLYNQLPE